MQYEKLPKITKEQAESKLKTVQGEDLCLLLLSMCELEDWKWVQDIYIRYLNSNDQWVLGAAITALGHLARIAGKIEKNKVIEALNKISSTNPMIKGKIDNAINDINMFA